MPPFSVSLPAPPSSVLLPLLPVSVFALELPVALTLADPVSVKPQEGSSACVQKPCAFPKDRDPAQGGYAAPPKYE